MTNHSDRSKKFTTIANTVAQANNPVLQEIVGRAESIAPFQEVWTKIIAEPLCHHTSPVSFSRGTLTVFADSPVWANRLRHCQYSVLALLNSNNCSNQSDSIHQLRIRCKLPEEKLSTNHSPSKHKPGLENSEPDSRVQREFKKMRKLLD